MTLVKVVSLSIAALVLSAQFSAQAALVPIDTGLWTQTLSPSSDRLSQNDPWVRVNEQTPTKLGNSSGSLISNFTVSNDFTFNGLFTPTFASNASCETENTCDDDDILGLVFGWQDARNHYRLGWSQGDGSNSSGVKDITGRTGLFLVKEVDGRSSTIQNWDRDFWLENVEYEFSISRFDDAISIAVEGIMQNIAGTQSGILPTQPATGIFQSIAFSTSDTTFMSGAVGVYTESQTAQFGSLNVFSSDSAVGVNAPSTWAVAALGGLVLLFTRRLVRK